MRRGILGFAFLLTIGANAASAACTPPSGSVGSPVEFSGARGGPWYLNTGTSSTSVNAQLSQTLTLKFTSAFGASFSNTSPARTVGTAALVTKNSHTATSNPAGNNTSEQFTPNPAMTIASTSFPAVDPASAKLVEWDATACTGYLELSYKTFQIVYTVGGGGVVTASYAIQPAGSSLFKRYFFMSVNSGDITLQSITPYWQTTFSASDLQTIGAAFSLTPRAATPPI